MALLGVIAIGAIIVALGIALAPIIIPALGFLLIAALLVWILLLVLRGGVKVFDSISSSFATIRRTRFSDVSGIIRQLPRRFNEEWNHNTQLKSVVKLWGWILSASVVFFAVDFLIIKLGY